MHGGLIEEMKACDKEPVNIYRTLKKIQAGMFRTGFNLWEIFRNLDPERKCYVTSHKFLTVLNGPLKNLIGLSDEEIIQVSDLFKTSDGQIAYEQFCHLIHDYRPPPSKLDLVQDDPNSVNKSLTRNEERVLYNTLMYIATTVTKRKLVLKPFFQDYEMIKKHSGLVTKTTFYKVLDFMGVKISKFAIDILVKRYERDDYTIKYNAFLSELDEVFQFLEANNYVDSSGRLWDPTKIPLYEKPPPGSGDQCGLRQVYLPSWINKSKVDPKEVINIILKFKQHICRNKIRIRDFFKEFDTKDTGRVDVHDFVMGLRWLSYGRVDPVNLFLNAKEIDIIMDLYADPIYPDRKLWKVLEEDLEGGKFLDNGNGKLLYFSF
ncbi:hypothetical protein O3M35_007886 [Rhynocoris fuscipes]|uniref:EF-hand domain-containing protein n=1 Tax=Rhynocoris fuscipes TaxID=488301 RepID=A0AAW1DI96_9HEMI